ncbi:MAG TPA: hypothetical protein VIM41_04155, partial [Gammaproteobacteria bacterium]
VVSTTALVWLLSGCLVDSTEPPPLIERSTDNLRLIQSGDRMVYDISGNRITTAGTAPIKGQMTVQWFPDFIEDPHNPTVQIPVLREETTFVYDGGGGVSTIRYVSQDPDGSLYVHAYYDKTIILYAGNYSASQTDYTYSPIQVVSSPLQMAGNQFSYRVLECLTVDSLCGTSIRAIQETNQFNSEAATVTASGHRFNTLYYVYEGQLLEGVSPSLPSPLDFRMACGGNTFTFNGEYYYFPEVGLVRFFSFCTAADASSNTITLQLSGSLSSASFPLP